MRISLLVLLLIAAGAALFFSALDGENSSLTKTEDLRRLSRGVSLEKAADYWLSAADERQSSGNLRGSGTALAVAIRLGRLEANRAGVQPVPRGLKRRFRQHFDEAVLDQARWTVAKPQSRLGRVLARWPVEEGAVTLGNIIVFKTESGSSNPRLFAHELAHVEQYRELGIEEFARRYAADPEPLEAQARKKARRIAAKGIDVLASATLRAGSGRAA